MKAFPSIKLFILITAVSFLYSVAKADTEASIAKMKTRTILHVTYLDKKNLLQIKNSSVMTGKMSCIEEAEKIQRKYKNYNNFVITTTCERDAQ